MLNFQPRQSEVGCNLSQRCFIAASSILNEDAVILVKVPNPTGASYPPSVRRFSPNPVMPLTLSHLESNIAGNTNFLTPLFNANQATTPLHNTPHLR
jgi:hypothetical protein